MKRENKSEDTIHKWARNEKDQGQNEKKRNAKDRKLRKEGRQRDQGITEKMKKDEGRHKEIKDSRQKAK